MSTRFMHNVQRSAGAAVWALPHGASTTLVVGPTPRVLQVIEGRLWLTTPGTADDAALDLWLQPGESVELDPGAHHIEELAHHPRALPGYVATPSVVDREQAAPPLQILDGAHRPAFPQRIARRGVGQRFGLQVESRTAAAATGVLA